TSLWYGSNAVAPAFQCTNQTPAAAMHTAAARQARARRRRGPADTARPGEHRSTAIRASGTGAGPDVTPGSTIGLPPRPGTLRHWPALDTPNLVHNHAPDVGERLLVVSSAARLADQVGARIPPARLAGSPSYEDGSPVDHDLRMPQAGRRRKLRRGWVAVTLAIALVGCITLVQWTWSVVADGAWWNVPFGLLSTGLTYWLGIA